MPGLTGPGYSGTAGQMLLTAQSFKPGASEIILGDGVNDTGYKLFQPDWGNSVWQNFESGQRGTQGARAAGGEPANRPLSIPLGILKTSTDLMHSYLATIQVLDDELRRFGGIITWRPKGATYKQYFDVLYSAGAGITNYDWNYHNLHYVVVTLAPVCAPYLRGDPMDIFDDFSTDSSADYAKDADGALLTIKGGQLVPTQTGTSRWRHTGRGYSYGDVEATVKATIGSTKTNYEARVYICGDTAGADTHLSAVLWSDSVRLDKHVAGTPTNLANTAFTLAANTTYWLRIRREGRRLTASVYTSEPTPLATPAATVSYTMSVVENWAYVSGHAGLRPVVVSTTEVYDDFRVEPRTYANNLLAPDERSLRPAIIGDAPALADLVVTQSGGTNPQIWGMGGWWQRPSVWNYVWNGDFEDDVDGWSVAAVAGVTGAATSIARSTSAARNKYGGANAQIVCPATANTGATFKINRRFYQGRDYQVLMWVSSAAGTTAARVRLGVSGDIVSSGGVPLTTTPTLRAAQIWSPTADRDGAYVVAEITAATGTTWNIDAIVVVEARSTTLTNVIDASQTTFVVDVIPDDWPSPPFLAYRYGGSELFWVDAINNATRTLTVVRGVEGTTGGVGAAGDPIFPLPGIRSHYEGKGAAPPVGVIEAEADDSGNRFTWALASSGTARLGNLLTANVSGAGSAAADWLVDPHLLIPDDYTQGEIAIEVWGQLQLHAAMTAPKAILSLVPENATVASGVITSNYGAIRYSEEFGSAGKLLVVPSSGSAFRFCLLGRIRFPVDRSRPLRSRLQLRITWTGATSSDIGCDYLVLVPSNQRALSPSGKVNDATFPKFLGSTAETTKTIRCDLSGRTAKPPFPPGSDHGLGGSLIELPQGNVDFLLKLCDYVPDDPSSSASGAVPQSPAGAAHLAVTPRFRTARSS